MRGLCGKDAFPQQPRPPAPLSAAPLTACRGPLCTHPPRLPKAPWPLRTATPSPVPWLSQGPLVSASGQLRAASRTPERSLRDPAQPTAGQPRPHADMGMWARCPRLALGRRSPSTDLCRSGRPSAHGARAPESAAASARRSPPHAPAPQCRGPSGTGTRPAGHLENGDGWGVETERK